MLHLALRARSVWRISCQAKMKQNILFLIGLHFLGQSVVCTDWRIFSLFISLFYEGSNNIRQSCWCWFSLHLRQLYHNTSEILKILKKGTYIEKGLWVERSKVEICMGPSKLTTLDTKWIPAIQHMKLNPRNSMINYRFP